MEGIRDFVVVLLFPSTIAGFFYRMDERREHAGGTPRAEQSFGQWHPLVPFDYDAVEPPPKDETVYSIDQVSEALSEIVRWMLNDGRFQQRGVCNRAIALAFLIQPNFIGVTSQVELAKRLGLSEAQTSEIVRSFIERFGFMAAHLRSRCREKCRQEKKQND